MRKKKIKKERKKLTRKQLIILIVVTIILGIICYFASTEITKNIIDKRTMEKRLANEDYSDLRELDTINNITLNDLINSFNEISDSDINIDDINDNKVMINDIEIEFNLNGDNINIISINFKKKSNDVKELISNMIIANNNEITEETTDLIYDRVFETLGNTEDENSETSEFFQYQGLEFSLKEYKDSNYKYSFRVGRIVKEETNEEE
ncbi:MAG TPA: hypothetical protein IAB59_02820 [Candidatus Onthousia faecipullorum]|uniref:Uncharacterized protein n=1 Tax=Candidatus Onthousia faecipullorum TaxID=2840887 RepID=A0A9D1GAM1_9FIRM|nr:hypothetical protein [Candidatus Onthousia faecipullorum]